MSDLIKDQPALLRLRHRIENAPKQINNSTLPAGSPMYFYCRICGHQSDVLPESYTSSPKTHCKECQELKKECNGLTDRTIIDEAMKIKAGTER